MSTECLSGPPEPGAARKARSEAIRGAAGGARAAPKGEPREEALATLRGRQFRRARPVSSLLGWPAPLLPVQILWINLVTDGLPALALSMERPDPDVMRRRPRPPGESLFSRSIGFTVLLQGLLVGGTALAAFGFFLAAFPDDLGRARTAVFCVLAYSELMRAFAARSQTRTLFELGPFTNLYLCGAIIVSVFLQLSVVTMPFARPVFETVEHFTWEWTLIAGLSLLPVTCIEVWKLIRKRCRKTR